MLLAQGLEALNVGREGEVHGDLLGAASVGLDDGGQLQQSNHAAHLGLRNVVQVRHGAALLHAHDQVNELFVCSRADQAKHRKYDDQDDVVLLCRKQNVHTYGIVGAEVERAIRR